MVAPDCMTRFPCELKRWWLLRLLSESEILTQQPSAKRYLLPKRFENAALNAEQRSSELFEHSRVQQRWRYPISRDRLFLRLIRRRRSRPSKLNQRLNSTQLQEQLRRRLLLAFLLSASVGAMAWGTLLISHQVTLGGVPYRIVHK